MTTRARLEYEAELRFLVREKHRIIPRIRELQQLLGVKHG